MKPFSLVKLLWTCLTVGGQMRLMGSEKLLTIIFPPSGWNCEHETDDHFCMFALQKLISFIFLFSWSTDNFLSGYFRTFPHIIHHSQSPCGHRWPLNSCAVQSNKCSVSDCSPCCSTAPWPAPRVPLWWSGSSHEWRRSYQPFHSAQRDKTYNRFTDGVSCWWNMTSLQFYVSVNKTKSYNCHTQDPNDSIITCVMFHTDSSPEKQTL